MTKEEILNRIVQIFVETFDMDASRVVPEANLADDLDIDSIDAIDLIVQIKPLVGQRLKPEAFKSVRTIGDVVDAVHAFVSDGGSLDA